MPPRLAKPLIIITLALLVPIVPFVIFGSALESWLQAWFEPRPSRWVIASLVAGILSIDILLPVPSSAVSTLSGAELGPWLGTLASWLGMTSGAILGFGLARWLGKPLVQRFAGHEELLLLGPVIDKYGPLVLVLLRALPVLAEASVLLVGAGGLSWWRFLIPVAFANFGIALAYSVFGGLATHYEFLPYALAVSIALPAVAAALSRKWLTNLR